MQSFKFKTSKQYKILVILKKIIFSCFFLLLHLFAGAQQKNKNGVVANLKSQIISGANQTEKYIGLLTNKRVALLVNQTAEIKGVTLPDTLKNRGINISTIFGPEHGFRGIADAGEKVGNYNDEKTGIPVISLYGVKEAPTKEDLKNIDILVYDIQDVGARFYTYSITLFKVMQACADANVPILLLDRPNPIANFIDGPILENDFKSGVGQLPIPIAHGLTMGEFAMMVNGQKWLKNGIKCKLKVIKIANYNHWKPYTLPIKPSPNLPNNLAIYLYPSLCLFEGTSISMGRGTLFPFQVIGHPLLKDSYNFSFMPISIKGMSKKPPLENQVCYGIDFRKNNIEKIRTRNQLDIALLLKIYNQYPEKENFFNPFFNKLAGNASLMAHIKSGKTETQIRATWAPALKKYKTLRKKYLLYP
ncbi:MAG: DUF1343 domain-containing protein [Sphingobacteriales bacterium]|nr:MAG: DUF1343 domain-containing protein [Sphingobacteriales bacterium]TAF82577.1 MAG: DUF1343 domain-containing protein [Sphingobacteriales bacterium]